MVTGVEGELPSIASGEREEGEGIREWTLMVVIWGEEEKKRNVKFVTMTIVQNCSLSTFILPV